MTMLVKTIIDDRRVYALAISPDNKFIVTANHSHKEGSVIKFWDFPRGTLIKSWSEDLRDVHSLQFSPDKKYLLFTNRDDSIIILDHHELEIKHVFKEFNKYIEDSYGYIYQDLAFNMAFSQDGKYLASTHDAYVIVWDYKLKTPMLVIGEVTKLDKCETGAHVEEVIFSPRGDYLITGSEDGLAKMWSFPDGLHIYTFEHSSSYSLMDLHITPDEKNLITSSSSPDGGIKIWNIITRNLTRKISANIERLILTPDGRYMIGGLTDNTLKVWEFDTGKVIWTTLAHEGFITSLQLTLDSKYFVSTSMDKTIKIWSLEQILE